ncbi:heavy-metal-associated domain protein [mine drainage metagenome]|uniref:Heavy-metal-associated domain protein n=1 Tax=mine drainage metagenome TaxID=410659 RepID=A0A1J5QEV9_9ZZZZ
MIKLSVPEMTCGHCRATVEKAVAGVDPAAKVVVDLASHSVEISSRVDTSTLIGALKAEGYEARLAT